MQSLQRKTHLHTHVFARKTVSNWVTRYGGCPKKNSRQTKSNTLNWWIYTYSYTFTQNTNVCVCIKYHYYFFFVFVFVVAGAKKVNNKSQMQHVDVCMVCFFNWYGNEKRFEKQKRIFHVLNEWVGSLCVFARLNSSVNVIICLILFTVFHCNCSTVCLGTDWWKFQSEKTNHTISDTNTHIQSFFSPLVKV